MPSLDALADNTLDNTVVINPHYDPAGSLHKEGTPDDPEPHEYLYGTFSLILRGKKETDVTLLAK